MGDCSSLIIMGNFNIHIDDDDDIDAQIFLDSMNAIGLNQYISQPTHVAGHILDQIYMDNQSKIGIIGTTMKEFISDHKLIQVLFNVRKPKVTSKVTTIRPYGDIDPTKFKQDLKRLKYEGDNIDELVEKFEKDMLNLLEKHCPLKRKRISERKLEAWFNTNIRQARATFRKCCKIWSKYKIDDHWNALKKSRNKYVNMINMEKRTILSQQVREAKGDTKKLYQIVRNLTGTKQENPLPERDDLENAEHFANFFMAKIDKIRNDLDHVPNYEPTEAKVETLTHFKPLSIEEIKKTVNALATKSCEIDAIPTKILKQYLNEFAPIIQKLVNTSLVTATFPSKWKEAILRPLIKKLSMGPIDTNYRPVSNLTFLSKVLEKAMLLRLEQHLQQKAPLPKNQSAYRNNHSCETALISLVDEILQNMEDSFLTAVVALDLSAAFDTVDHDILANVMRRQFGVSESALDWIRSYLSPRFCKVNVGDIYSSLRQLHYCVPQGSVSGPKFFLCYI